MAIQTEKISDHVSEETRTLVAADLKKYSAKFAIAESRDGVLDAMLRNGITVAEINSAMREIKRESFKVALSAKKEDILSNLVKALTAAGVPQEQADAMAEAQRSVIGNTLPAGLTAVMENGVHVLGKRKGKAPAVKA